MEKSNPRRANHREKSVTIVDVAREAQVSLATTSRVINNEAHVRPEKRERVLRAMDRLGYTVNLQARSLRGGRSRMIGLVVRDVGTGYAGEIVRGIDLELAESEYDMMLYTTHRRKIQESAYVDMLSRGMADGLLLILPRHPEAYLRVLRQRRYPHVLIDHQGIDDRGPAIGATNWQGAFDATQYLIELGHRRIGFICGSMDLGCARERLAGYQAALKHFGLPADPAMVREGDFFQTRGYSAADELLSMPTPPTAIFASNDVSAFGVMEAVRDHQLRIPDDISIVGFDDVPQATQVHPPLTTVRQPLEQMGRAAARLLLKIIQEPKHPAQRVDLPTELVIRETTRKPRDGTG
ncbi:MAG: LacI family transcriptional regulator [Chloroflexi bacterium]|nr:LacI family transcriptional regulator [Chloroflexota bacterium]